ncbi:MAG: glutamate--tRNA ligase [Candidatus Woesearchaeota archaeon]|nr:glutamate--tRNA ligase [Candidatus Woesearchaeota archaeon]
MKSGDKKAAKARGNKNNHNEEDIADENQPKIKMGLMSNLRKYALHNAVLHNGKADVKAVLGKAISEDNSLKSQLSEIKELIDEVVDEVNCSKLESQLAMLKEIAPELLEKKEGKRELKELPNAEMGKVVTRIPPEPSKYNHIGHALSFLINYLYAKKYKGKCILRFEDTNPLKGSQEYVDAMKEDVLQFLEIKPDEIIFASDEMPKFYDYAEKLIKMGKAYVCFCAREEMQDSRHKGLECKCRNSSLEKNFSEWKNMLSGKYSDGQCVLRLKANMQAENQVMRDPVIFRIVSAEHYRQKDKYKVWPVYDFENAIEDSTHGTTHILRSSEFGTMRVELQTMIKELLGLSKQTVIQYGRFSIVGATTQGREIRELIEKGKATGWDDISLVTIRALKRRGFVKETFYELAIQVGLSPTPTTLDWTFVSSVNRKIIDPFVKRYFFVSEPVKIKVENAPDREEHLKLHPEHPEYGERKFKTHSEFYISKEDFDLIEDKKLYRLMDCLNFRKENDKMSFVSASVDDYRKEGERIMHWLPADSELIDAVVLMPDHSMRKGFLESNASALNVGDEVQFERFGFCRLDKKDGNKFSFWYTHK